MVGTEVEDKGVVMVSGKCGEEEDTGVTSGDRITTGVCVTRVRVLDVGQVEV